MATQTKIGRGRPKREPLTLDGPIPEHIGIMDALSLVRQLLQIPISYRWFHAKAQDPTSGMPVHVFEGMKTSRGTDALFFRWENELKPWALENMKRVNNG